MSTILAPRPLQQEDDWEFKSQPEVQIEALFQAKPKPNHLTPFVNVGLLLLRDSRLLRAHSLSYTRPQAWLLLFWFSVLC